MIVYVVFVTGILSMVYVASRQTNEMQDDNYYAKELKYQDVIDGRSNLAALHENVSISETDSAIRIRIPQAASVQMSDAKFRFLCPSDKKKDLNGNLSVDRNGEQLIPRSAISKGYYAVEVSWKSGQKGYYSEQNFAVK